MTTIKLIVISILLVFALAIPAMAFDAGTDLKLEGDVFAGYVISSSYDIMTDSQIMPGVIKMDTSSAKWTYTADVKFTWKNRIRPWLFFQGISGYSASNSWAMETQQFSAGIDYLFYSTNYGSAFARIGYTNWKSSIDATMWGVQDLNAQPESDTWAVGLGWKF